MSQEVQERKYYPHAVVWEITFACNMRCLHCGTAAGQKRSDELTHEEAIALVDELCGLGAQEITLSGGEPLLRKDWPQLAQRIIDGGSKAYLITNGYAVDEKIVDEFERINFTNIGVSFDGTEPTHNHIRQREKSFKRAKNAMQMMSDRGNIRFCAITQVSNMNLNEMDEIKQILQDVGCRQWRIQMTTSTGRMKEQDNMVLTTDKFPYLVDKLLEYKEEGKIDIDVGENIGFYGCKGTQLWDGKPYFGCFAGMRVAGITSNGEVRGCLSMPEYFNEGNIRDSSFTEIWDDPNNFMYNRVFRSSDAGGWCKECKYLPLCRGGCATTSFSATNMRANNPYCMYQIEKANGIECEDNEMIQSLLDHVHKQLGGKVETVEK
ncbi:MAG TPA: radical SAM protein [candidate division Zixibacteria bacterium]|nr:radical SAM protein [candidate division Zixibacteria bacterium]HER00480.1 radical SAM protein [candidate division Zixibacteria bacterium]